MISSQPRRRRLRVWVLVGLVASVILSVWWVQPMREAPLEDDFAYAWSVQRWLETGRLELHDWASAAPLTLIGLGAVVSKAFGFTFFGLRCVTLFLAIASLPAIVRLARLHDATKIGSLLAAFSVWSSPLFLRFSFNFMTDVPFVALSTMALASMTRALRDGDGRRMFVGSALAAAAVLTRQFAAAIVPALALTWLLDPSRPRRSGLYWTGAILPGLAALVQLYLVLANPTWAASLNSHRVAEYWGDIRSLAWQWPWRLAVTLQYMGLFALPILAAHMWALRRRGPIRQKWLLLSGAVIAAGTLAGVTLGYASVWMPIVGWNLSVLIDLGDGAVVASTVVAGVGGIAAGYVVLGRIDEFRGLRAEERLLDLFVLCSFGLTLVYVQFGDEYLLIYLPYLAVLSARAVPASRRAVLALLASMTLSSLVASDWTRRILHRAEIPWQLGEAAVARGVPPSCVSGAGGWQWMAYHSMDDFVARYDPATESPRGFWLFWSEWIPRRKANALAFYGPIPATADNSIPGAPVITTSLPGHPPGSFGLWIVPPASAEWDRRLSICAPVGTSRRGQALPVGSPSLGGGGSRGEGRGPQP